MRTTLYVVSSTIAFSLVMVSPENSFAQAYQTDWNDVSRRAGFVCRADLFEVPADYVETQLNLHFVVENPYAQDNVRLSNQPR